VLLGDAYRFAGDARAGDEYRAALELDPQNAEARRHVGP